MADRSEIHLVGGEPADRISSTGDGVANDTRRRHMSRRVRAAVVAAVLLAAFGFGRISAPVHPVEWVFDHVFDFSIHIDPDVDPALVERLDREQFETMVDAWKEHILKHNGDTPADPYRVLYDSGKLGPLQLRDYDFSHHIPPRLNPELRQNGKWVIFSRNYTADGPEQWQCYADGTWARVRLPPGMARAPVGFGMAFVARRRLADAGYPVDQWKTEADRAAWLARNEDALVWYPPWKMYVVRGAPATRPTPGTP